MATKAFFESLRVAIFVQVSQEKQVNATSRGGLVPFWTLAGDLPGRLVQVDVQMQIAILGTSFCMAQLRRSKKMRQTEELQEMEKKIADLSQELDFLQTRRDLLVEEVGEPTETESNLGA